MIETPPQQWSKTLLLRRRWVWIAVACAAVLLARTLRAEPLPLKVTSSRSVIRLVTLPPAAGQIDDERAALEVLQAVVDRRPELAKAFSGSGRLDVDALLQWATSDNDSDSVLLSPQRHALQRIQARLRAGNGSSAPEVPQ